MPEFNLPEEADRCPHCGAALSDPPTCCEQAEQDHSEQMHRENNPHYLTDDGIRETLHLVQLPDGTVGVIASDDDDADFDWHNDCPHCEGDGCPECDYTGEYE